MSKNGWISCIVIVLVLLCACIFCLLISLAGVAGYLYISPSIDITLPFSLSNPSTPTTTPFVIRPTLPTPIPATHTPATGSAPLPTAETPTPVILPGPVGVPTDTLFALVNTFLPENDPIDLAHRLLHLDNLSPTVAPPPAYYQVGDRQSFWVGNGDVENFKIQATLRYVTDHSYFWIEDGVDYRQSNLSALSDSFENQIYPTDRQFFGSEWTPGVDGDPHIYILYARGIGDENAGYFSSADEYPRSVNKYSNQHEMFLVNADNSPLDDEYTFGVLAHELQHMIHWHLDKNEDNWLGEGFSELAVLLNNFYNGGFDAVYTSSPDLQLNNWPDKKNEDTTPHYGAGFLFVSYFLDRFGESATQALVKNPDNGLSSIDSTLKQINATDPITGKLINADSFFLDWAITNYLMDPQVGDGRYSYVRYTHTPHAIPAQSFKTCPVSSTNDVHQYGVDYIRFSCPGSHTLHFEGSIQIPLLPEDPHSGKYAWWANKSDESDNTLSQTFDFTNHTGPISMSYWTWYDIENGWDFAYLEASTDGKNWEILDTPSGTSANPQGNNYGIGYTGLSGGGSQAVWVHEKVDLSRYAGQKLTLRFEYITDSNVTGEGFLLDDISIPEIGYASDFETGDGGWQPAGWVRIENILPQSFKLALILEGKTTTVQYIPLNPDVTADVRFTIGSGVKDAVLVVAGTARYTRQLAAYHFSVSQP